MVEYIWHEGPVPKNMRVTQVAGILFNDKNEILLRKDKNGVYGLAGGHPEGNETREETLHREVDEEVNCKIDELQYLGYQAVHGDGEPYAQLRYSAHVAEFGSSRPDPDNGQTYERIYVPAKDANKYLKYGKAGDQIIAVAIKTRS
ncbi:NUDIX domain-containing protein [Candidatus Saccharibacteria bacterium]|nr:NUDIX domain-containing protein [Candidatus Saccharibacteria bacterium]